MATDLIVRLGPTGSLVMYAPHQDGTAIGVQLPADPELAMAILIRTLTAQQSGEPKLTGTKSAPTQWEIDHTRLDPVSGMPTIRVLATKSRKIKQRAITLADLGL